MADVESFKAYVKQQSKQNDDGGLRIQDMRKSIYAKIDSSGVSLVEAITVINAEKDVKGKSVIDKFTVDIPYVDSTVRVSPTTRVSITYPTDDFVVFLKDRQKKDPVAGKKEVNEAIDFMQQQKILDDRGVGKLKAEVKKASFGSLELPLDLNLSGITFGKAVPANRIQLTGAGPERLPS